MKRLSICTGVVLLALSCNKGGGDSGSSSGEGSGEGSEETTEQTTEAGTVALPATVAPMEVLEPADMFLHAEGTIESTGSAGALAIETTQLLEDTDEPDPDNPNCNVNAQPLNPVTKKIMSEAHPFYAVHRAKCMINAPGSSESITGSIAMVKGILCALENSVGTIEYTAAGKEYKDIEVSVSEKCFKKGFVSRSKADGFTGFKMTFTATELGSDSQFRKMLTLNMPGEKPQVKIVKFLSTEDLFAFHTVDNPDSDESDSTSVSVDRGAGVLRYESISRRWGNHARLIAHGDFDGPSFKEFDAVELIWQRFEHPSKQGGEEGGEGGEGAEGGSTPDTSIINAPIVTVKGNRNDGFMFRLDNYRCGWGGDTPACKGFKGGVFVNQAKRCIAGAGSCEGNDGIVFSDADFDYLTVNRQFDQDNGQAKVDAVKSWITNGDVLCFSSAHKSVLPNTGCETATVGAGLTAAETVVPKAKAYLRQAGHDSPRMSGWADECEGKQSKVNTIYELNGATTPASTVAAVAAAANPHAAFTVLAAAGSFYGAYELTATVKMGDQVLGTQQISGPQGGSQEVRIPLSGLAAFNAQGKIELHISGTLTCHTTSAAGKTKAFSVSLSTPVSRIEWDR